MATVRKYEVLVSYTAIGPDGPCGNSFASTVEATNWSQAQMMVLRTVDIPQRGVTQITTVVRKVQA